MTSTFEDIRNVLNISKSKFNRYIEKFDNDQQVCISFYDKVYVFQFYCFSFL